MKEQLLAQQPGKTNEIYFLEESLDKRNIYFRSLPVEQIDTFCETTELKFDRFTENGVPVLVKSQPEELLERLQAVDKQSFVVSIMSKLTDNDDANFLNDHLFWHGMNVDLQKIDKLLSNLEDVSEQPLETLKRKLHETVNKIEHLNNERVVLQNEVQTITLQIETFKAMSNMSLEMDENDLLLQSEMEKMIAAE